MNSRPFVITIDEQGATESLGNPLGLPGVLLSKKRFSEIVPVNPLLRFTFRTLRRLFGDNGYAAAWTRNWVCIWEARILSTGETARCLSRERLIEWEHIKYYSMKHEPKCDL